MQNQTGKTPNKANTAAVLRGVVAVYLIVLGYKIITNQDTTMAHTTACLLGGAMILAALLFAGYTVFRLLADKKAADHDDSQGESL